MRALSRALRRGYAAFRARGRRVELEAELGDHLGQPLILSRAGARGRDSVYLARSRSGRPLAVVRLVNPYLERGPLASDSPFVVLGARERLEREWSAYRRGAGAGLTPRPLWRAADALACEHVPGVRLSERLLAEPEAFWRLIGEGARALADLHAAGLTHLDASPANIIDAGPRRVFIDFEYGPRAGLGAREQRAYDHLRLVESVIKFMPERAAGGFAEWAAWLARALDSDTRRADLSALAPALGRLLADRERRAALARVFPSLGA